MSRVILAVIAGFVLWSILWVGSDAVFSLISSDWGKTSAEFREAIANKTPYTLSSTVLIALLIKGFIVSIVSGFITASIAGKHSPMLAAFALGVLLLAFGGFIQASVWNYMPVWYHLVFLALLIPMSLLGGRFRTA